MSKTYTMDEVKEHNKMNDAWVVIHGKVYDVTEYLYDHPGGDDVLFAETGGDGTAEFDAQGHSDEAFEEMKEYYIGDLAQ